jgi:hypothetical protein
MSTSSTEEFRKPYVDCTHSRVAGLPCSNCAANAETLLIRDIAGVSDAVAQKFGY